jgi:hypothetical protein
MSGMRVIFEARDGFAVHRVERDVRADNWRDEQRNKDERRQGIIDAANGLLRSLNLDELEEVR